MMCARCGSTHSGPVRFCLACGDTLGLACPHCAAPNAPTVSVCATCGRSTGVACPVCAVVNPEHSRFCGQCATPLVERERLSIPMEERRHITVMFADLIGSTELSARLDPEDLRDVVRAFQAACDDVVRRYEGHVAQYLGDGVLVYFGYPQAHEDDAHRSVRAALEIVRRVGGISIGDRRLQVRVGIHTGSVVISEVGGVERREHLALGETPNVAARVQGLANADSVLISDATWRRVRGFFHVEDRGAHALKGLQHPVRMYRVVRANEAETRLGAAAALGLTPYLGREAELQSLTARWDAARSGALQAAMVRGEPGIGKSRLVEIFQARVRTDHGAVFVAQCSPYHQNSALHPVVEMLQRWLRTGAAQTPEARRQALDAAVVETALADPLAAPLLAAFLGLPSGGIPTEMTPLRRRQRTLDVLCDWMLAQARRRATLVVFEDLHWADPTTVDLLSQVLSGNAAVPLLVCGTARPEFRIPWGAQPNRADIELAPVSPEEAATMIAHVAGGKALPEAVTVLVVERSAGVPLFVEEITKAVLEKGVLRELEDRYELAGPVPPGLIPASVQDSLTARIDRLGESRTTAQLAAIIGRDFGYPLLRSVSPLADSRLQADLSRLLDAELVFQYGELPQAVFTFKHALIRDAASESLVRRVRQQYHQQIAGVLQREFTDVAEAQPELMASHFEGAGMSADAIAEWQRAGQRASGRANNREAIAHLQRALALLDDIPSERDRKRLDLDAQLTLAPALMAVEGWASPRTGAACIRARDLCHELGDRARLFAALWGLWTFQFVGGDLGPALATAQQTAEMASASGNPLLELAAHHTMGYTQLYRAELAEANSHGVRGMALYEPDRERELIRLFQLSSSVTCASFRAASDLLMGFPDRAERGIQAMLALAREIGHLPSTASAMGYAVFFYHFALDPERTRAIADELFVLSNEQGFQNWLAVSFIYRAWARTRQGEADQGIAELLHGIPMFRAIGARLTLIGVYAQLAEALVSAGRIDEALDVTRDGLAEADERGEHLCQPELHRLRAEALLRRAPGDRATAEASFRDAITLARSQGARTLELRAIVGLCPVLDSDGRRDEARGLLRECYSGFTEGLGTRELQSARALLTSLGG